MGQGTQNLSRESLVDIVDTIPAMLYGVERGTHRLRFFNSKFAQEFSDARIDDECFRMIFGYESVCPFCDSHECTAAPSQKNDNHYIICHAPLSDTVSQENNIDVRALIDKQTLSYASSHGEEIYGLLRTITDNVPFLLWAKDRDGKYIFANKETSIRVFGTRDVTEPIGKDESYVSPHYDAKRLYSHIASSCKDSDTIALEQQKQIVFEEQAIVDGKTAYLEIIKAPLVDTHGDIIGTVGVGRDITMEKNHQAELLALNTALKKQADDEVQKRLKQEILVRQNHKMALMGEMMGAITHQWRQPLNALSMLIHEIVSAYTYREIDAATCEKFKEQSKQQIAFMSQTIDDFRDYFREDKTKSEFLVSEKVYAVVSLLQPQFAMNGITVSVDSSTGGRVYGYANEFMHAVLNIINNAKDAIMTSDTVNKTIDIHVYEKANMCVLTVHDHAGGIEQDILGRLFDPYVTTKGDSCGTGIGLYLCKTIIVEHMGGELTAQNENDGALFQVSLPLSVSH